MFYEVHKRVLVVDYPGTKSLDHHAETFSICGTMNNLTILVVPFTGDMNRLISDEVANVFKVSALSQSSRAILCINKCGEILPKVIQKELKDKSDPIDYLKEHFTRSLNEFYKKEKSNVTMEKERIFFTDWIVGDREDMAKWGICGVNKIKKVIKEHLIAQKVFHDPEELDIALNRNLLETA